MNQTNSHKKLDLSTSINSYANEDDIHLIHNSNFDFGIYEELLKDRIITLSFKEAIEKNSEIFKDKVI